MIFSDKERLFIIVSIWSDLKKQIEENHINKENLLNNQFYQWAVTTPLYNIGEQVYNLSSEFKRLHPEIQWNLVSGLRHRLVHDYEGINWSIIVEVVFDNMDSLISDIQKIIDSY